MREQDMHVHGQDYLPDLQSDCHNITWNLQNRSIDSTFVLFVTLLLCITPKLSETFFLPRFLQMNLEILSNFFVLCVHLVSTSYIITRNTYYNDVALWNEQY